MRYLNSTYFYISGTTIYILFKLPLIAPTCQKACGMEALIENEPKYIRSRNKENYTLLSYENFICAQRWHWLLLLLQMHKTGGNPSWNSFKSTVTATWEASLVQECLALLWSCTAWRSCCPTRTRRGAATWRRACRRTPCAGLASSSRPTWWRAWSECLVSPFSLCALASGTLLKRATFEDYEIVHTLRRLRQNLQVLALALASSALFDRDRGALSSRTKNANHAHYKLKSRKLQSDRPIHGENCFFVGEKSDQGRPCAGL